MAEQPTSQQVRERRTRAGLTQTEAAELLGVNERTWQYWESGLYRMRPALWELFVLKTPAADA